VTGINLLRAADRQVDPWKNGGGRTSEVAVFPPHAGLDDFEWRISVASVAVPGRFSIFGGVDRTLAVISGRLKLAFDHEAKVVELTPDSPPHHFAGDVGVVGTPVDGQVIDLNLMTRRGRWRGEIERIEAPRSRSIILASPIAIVMFADEGRLQWQGNVASAGPFDAIRIDAAEGGAIKLDSNSSVYVLSLFADSC
jgi:environmental stress-induced protein Ves